MQRPLGLLPASAYENLLVVSSDAPPAVEEVLVDQGVDPSNVGMIPISGSAIEYDGPLWTSEPVVPDDLTGLSMRFSSALDALQPGIGWVMFDSLNVLLLYAQEDRVCRFIDHVTTTTRNRDVRGVYTVVRDAVDDATYETIQRSFDQELDFR